MADTREEAAAGAAKIAQTCGTCHTENGVPLGERFTLGDLLLSEAPHVTCPG